MSAPTRRSHRLGPPVPCAGWGQRWAASLLLCLSVLGMVLPLSTAGAQTIPADVYVSPPQPRVEPYASTASLSIGVGNLGPSIAESVVLTLGVPAGVTVLSATVHSPWPESGPGPDDRSCEPSAPATMRCVFEGAFRAGALGGVTLVVVNTGLAPGTTVRLAGLLTTASPEQGPGSNDLLFSMTFDGAPVGLDTADLAVSGDALDDGQNPSIRNLTFSVRNDGPGTAVGATLTVEVPEGTALIGAEPPASPPWEDQQPTRCTLAPDRRRAVCVVGRDLPLGHAELIRATVANTGLAAGTTGDVTITARASTEDGVAANDSLAVPFTFAGGPVALDAADLGLTMLSGRPLSDARGVPLTFAGGPLECNAADLGLTMLSGRPLSDPAAVRIDLTLFNHGPADATAITVTIDAPEGVVIGSAQSAPPEVPSFAACPMDPPTARLVCTSADLPIGAGRLLPIVAINVGLPAGSSLQLHATVSHRESDPNTANDELSMPITFSGPPVATRAGEATTELVLTAIEPRFEKPGEVTFVWNIAVRGPAAAEGLTAVVQLGNGLRPVWAGLLPSGGACPLDSTATITCRLPRPWPVGEPLGLVVTAAYDNAIPGQRLEAEVFVASQRTDLAPGDNHLSRATSSPGAAPQPTAVTAAQNTALPATGRDLERAWLLGAASLAVGLHLVLFARRTRAWPARRVTDRRPTPR